MLFVIYWYRDHRDSHSFPTRRSSDLTGDDDTSLGQAMTSGGGRVNWRVSGPVDPPSLAGDLCGRRTEVRTYRRLRSEEHTSELQSLRHLVCRLLLEKKNKKKSNKYKY